MIWGIFPPLSGWTEPPVSIFQSSAQTVKLQKGTLNQAGLPSFLTAILSSWIEQWYSWKVGQESRQSLFSEIILATGHQGYSISISEQHKGFYSKCREGRTKDACTCSGLWSVLSWEVDNSYCDLCQNSGAEIVNLWFPFWQEVLMGILLGMLWWVSLSRFF